MTKDLIRGFLLAHNAPEEILSALNLLGEPLSVIPQPCFLPKSIKDWALSVRASNVLIASGIDTKTKLLSLCESELLRLPNFGRKSLNEVKEYIKPLTFAHYGEAIKLVRDSYGYMYPTESDIEKP